MDLEEEKFYISRSEMLVMLIGGVVIFVVMANAMYPKSYQTINWPVIIMSSLVILLAVYAIIYSVKELFRPTLLVTLTKAGVAIEKKKKIIHIKWEDIESYMIYRGPSPTTQRTNFYIFTKKGIESLNNQKHISVEIHHMKNRQKLIEIFDERPIKKLPPDYEIVKKLK